MCFIGLGGFGGPYRLDGGHQKVYQVPQWQKDQGTNFCSVIVQCYVAFRKHKTTALERERKKGYPNTEFPPKQAAWEYVLD